MIVNKKRLRLEMFFLFFVLQQTLLANTSGIFRLAISYADELIVLLIMFGLLIYNRRINRLIRTEKVMILAIIGFDLVGLVSNFIHPLQTVFLNLSDLLVCNKFLAMYLFARVLYNDYEKSKKLLLGCAKICKFLVAIVFILTVHDLLFSPIFPKSSFRYFTYAIQLFFVHPTIFAVVNILFATVIIASLGINKHSGFKDYIFIAMALFCACLSLRTKAFAGVCCIIFIYLIFIKFKIKSKLIIGIGSAVIALLIGWDQLIFFFGKATEGRDDFIRAKLLRDSVSLANQYFPLGTGFATFGSNIAAENYSPLYYNLGYASTPGSSSTSNSFLSDSFWPIIISQTGWIGFILFWIVLICLIGTILKIKKRNSYLFWAGISIVAYEMIASIAESAFFHPASLMLFIVLGLIVNVGLSDDSMNDNE